MLICELGLEVKMGRGSYQKPRSEHNIWLEEPEMYQAITEAASKFLKVKKRTIWDS